MSLFSYPTVATPASYPAVATPAPTPVDASFVAQTRATVGHAVVPSRLKAFYDTYLDAPNKEIKATVLAAATAGVVFRGRHGN